MSGHLSPCPNNESINDHEVRNKCIKRLSKSLREAQTPHSTLLLSFAQ